ncbi:MAG: Tad domain-containing protein [Anaerolineae bacterium]|nr:Tad domain-containing protein [Anaerolineae bacterium]
MEKERGQALVILAFALIALVAFAGLAIDGGRTYSARRQAQNTADAVAMAGTRLLGELIASCEPVDALAADGAIAAEMVKLARDNGVIVPSEDADLQGWYVDNSETPLGRVGWGYGVPDGATGIEATVATTDTATFLKVVGQEHVVAGAKAMAMTGPVYLTEFSGGGLLPMAFPVQRVDSIISSGDYEFTMFDGDGAICDRDGVDCPSDPPQESQRGWLNFNYMYHNSWFPDPTAGNHDGINANGDVSSPLNRLINTNFSNNDLREWVANGPPFPIYIGSRGDASRPDDLSDPWRYPRDGDLIAGDPGTRDATRRDVCTLYLDQTVYLPLFDYIIERRDMERSDFFQAHEPSSPLAFPNAHYYHIMGFMAATVDGCQGGGSNGTIDGTFQAAFIGEGTVMPGQGFNSGGGSGGGGTCDLGFVGVQLWE